MCGRTVATINPIHDEIDVQGPSTGRTQCTVAASGELRVTAGDHAAEPTIKIIAVMIRGFGPVEGRRDQLICRLTLLHLSTLDPVATEARRQERIVFVHSKLLIAR